MSSKISGQSRQDVRAFWSGPDLSFYEQLSLKSMVASGARVLLYTYEEKLSTPVGVNVVDAREILAWPSDGYREGNRNSSLALHSDLFRYIALHRFGGWYIDLDLILLREKLPGQETYLAYAGPEWINTAVMKFPAGSSVMAKAIAEAQKLLLTTDLSIHKADRGIVGPTLMTRLVPEYALEHLVLPKSHAFEIEYAEALDFFNPDKCEAIEKRLASSDFVHLWNEVTRFVRIPKNLGPPAGSYLDAQFRRHDIVVPELARLSYKSIEDWAREYQLLRSIKQRLSTEAIDESSLDDLARSIQKWGWQPIARPARTEDTASAVAQHRSISIVPQTIRTFWQGDVIGPYQLTNLKSFVDRGHRVEVFSYNLNLNAPSWIAVKDATDVLPREDVLLPLSEEGRFAIHANLFRYALLHKLGGWWIDPDVLLLTPDLPDGDIFLAAPDAFGLVPTAVLKFPAGHPLLADAIAETRTFGDTLEGWEQSGSKLLTILTVKNGLTSSQSQQSVGPVSWFDVARLFDPSKADELRDACNGYNFLHLYHEVWRRAGIPHDLAPPEGSFLDSLLLVHDAGSRFPARMSFGDLNRWLAHMYQCVRQRLDA